MGGFGNMLFKNNTYKITHTRKINEASGLMKITKFKVISQAPTLLMDVEKPGMMEEELTNEQIIEKINNGSTFYFINKSNNKIYVDIETFVSNIKRDGSDELIWLPDF